MEFANTCHFLTAKSRTEDIINGFESGGNDYLKKPFSLD
jgi:DNA-binding response OmpR family regulator